MLYMYEDYPPHNINTTRLLIRQPGQGVLEKYSPRDKKWVEDRALYHMHIGDLFVEQCTEDEAMLIKERLDREYDAR